MTSREEKFAMDCEGYGSGSESRNSLVKRLKFVAGIQAAPDDRDDILEAIKILSAPVSERGLSREPTEVMVQSVRGIKIQPEMVRVIWRSMWDAAQSNERNWT